MRAKSINKVSNMIQITTKMTVRRTIFILTFALVVFFLIVIMVMPASTLC